MVSLDRSDDYRIRLSIFEGPIDLLLYLIRKNELDIHEISLADVAKEYLDYVELIKLIDLERAGDFIVMASTLMKIKARSLFGSGAQDGSLDDGDDPRATLVRYLMEFEKLGDLADQLAEKEAERQGVFPRGGEEQRIAAMLDETPEEPDYLLFDLLRAIRDVVKNAPVLPTHEVSLIKVNPEMKRREILEIIDRDGELDFIGMVKGQHRIVIVVSFVAMLELIRNGSIGVRQSRQFGRIVLYRKQVAQEGNSGE